MRRWWVGHRNGHGRGHVGLRFFWVVVAISALLFSGPEARAQALPTATRAGDLQLGGGLVLGSSTYNFDTSHLLGAAVYTSFDVSKHWGAEFNFHYATPSDDSTVHEQTYEAGPRYHIVRGPLVPYIKGMYGRGVYNFHNGIANIAYNTYTVGGGVDYRVLRSWNIRADYEYQGWPGFPLGTLHPSVVTIGFAYHLHE